MNCTTESPHAEASYTLITVPVSAIPFPPEERCIRSNYSRQSAACATHPLVRCGTARDRLRPIAPRGRSARTHPDSSKNRRRDTPVVYRLAAWHGIIIGGESESSIPSHSSMLRRGSFYWSWLADSINSERQLQISFRSYVLTAPKSCVSPTRSLFWVGFFRFGKPAPE